MLRSSVVAEDHVDEALTTCVGMAPRMFFENWTPGRALRSHLRSYGELKRQSRCVYDAQVPLLIFVHLAQALP